MNFVGRKNELQILAQQQGLSQKSAKMTVVYGRRRVGKTTLILESVKKHDYAYLFVSKKSEMLLCEDFVQELTSNLGLDIFGNFVRFADLFRFLMDISKQRPFTLVIDEFQEFYHINPAIYGEMQSIWDRYKRESKMNLIISGSVFSIMKKIFENAKEPLFGRTDARIHLQPFDVNTIKNIYQTYYPKFENQDLLAFYVVTGGVPKYVELLIDKSVQNLEEIASEIFSENSYWLDEGKNLLVEDFGREHTVYFSILSLIASSKTSRTDIESILERNIGGYLDRLINDFQIVNTVKPILAKPQGKVQKYMIIDNFLQFWFRYIFKNKSAIETKNFQYLRDVFLNDFRTYSGKLLERWFVDQLKLTSNYTAVGNYWDRKGNEIDIVGLHEGEQFVEFIEVKMNREKVNLDKLRLKSLAVLKNLPGYKSLYGVRSLEDM